MKQSPNVGSINVTKNTFLNKKKKKKKGKKEVTFLNIINLYS